MSPDLDARWPLPLRHPNQGRDLRSLLAEDPQQSHLTRSPRQPLQRAPVRRLRLQADRQKGPGSRQGQAGGRERPRAVSWSRYWLAGCDDRQDPTCTQRRQNAGRGRWRIATTRLSWRSCDQRLRAANRSPRKAAPCPSGPGIRSCDRKSCVLKLHSGPPPASSPDGRPTHITPKHPGLFMSGIGAFETVPACRFTHALTGQGK